ncbi:hypothetical protein EA004_19635 [Vibrio anguillarum]|uniref:DUF3693 domain-containing protein n=2 Tax=Vibrio anguillarum TaxID=55601 RepID=UPI00097E4027|nr:DUF3693 domain-containing protein [Vibrio anguillarum]MBF4247183.1 hypothetical protein [Vibrio anguillarum]MBF4342964.1 hypothetical protein [Vibrio anguillarum]MBY7672871.1 hypothetical protein [Vibrio anguillarum]STY92469.1 Phage related protein [Vibrio anguillarum]
MYQSQLLDAYKKAQNYIQDKQIAHDLNLPRQRIGEMRKGLRYISDEEAVFLAEQAGIDPELALLGCHADRNENPRIKQLWEHIAKKHNGLGLRTISMGCGALALMVSTKTEVILQCALWTINYVEGLPLA